MIPPQCGMLTIDAFPITLPERITAMIFASVLNIDAFVTILTNVPDGASRSLLTTAALREGLHADAFGYVLLVKAQSASTMQLVNNKPLWMKDTFSLIATASITWLLLEARNGDVVDGDVTTGTAQLNGKMGRSLDFAG